MALSLRSYEPHDFAALYRLDQSCFPAGISYAKTTLRYFLTIPSADCMVAVENGKIVGFIVSEENPPLAHIITLDVDEKPGKLVRIGIPGNSVLGGKNLPLDSLRKRQCNEKNCRKVDRSHDAKSLLQF